MHRFRSSPLLVAIVGSAGLALSIALISHALLPDWRWYHPLLHTAIEALGGLCAIVLGLVLFQQHIGRRELDSRALGLGLLAMGVLEECHAVSEPGHGFILLRSLASVCGAVGFALAWLPHSPRAFARPWLPWATAGGAAALGVCVLAFSDRVPDMIQQGAFTPAAVIPTSLAALLFLASAGRLWQRYRHVHTSETYLFSSLALLFGLAELMFAYSLLWDVRWWFWHFLRLLGYGLVLGFMVRAYRRMVVDLRIALTQTREAEETARRSEQHLRQVLEERERMGQDLHDGIIQSLFALTLNLERCQRLARTQVEEVIGQLGLAVTGVKTAIRDLRGFLVGLRPDIANGRELEHALVLHAKLMEDVSDLKVAVQVDSAAAQLVAPDQAMHVLYITREALSNALRHSRASRITLVLERQTPGIRLSVEDDGIGFQMGTRQDGEGLRNMQARAARLHGRLQVSSGPDRGTRVVFELPLEPVHA